MKVLEDRQSKSSVALLGSSEERVKLLRAGFSGKQIEALYLVLNSFEIGGVNWQPPGVWDMTDYICGIDGWELTEKAVNSGAGSCYTLHSQNANAQTVNTLGPQEHLLEDQLLEAMKIAKARLKSMNGINRKWLPWTHPTLPPGIR